MHCFNDRMPPMPAGKGGIAIPLSTSQLKLLLRSFLVFHRTVQFILFPPQISDRRISIRRQSCKERAQTLAQRAKRSCQAVSGCRLPVPRTAYEPGTPPPLRRSGRSGSMRSNSQLHQKPVQGATLPSGSPEGADEGTLWAGGGQRPQVSCFEDYGALFHRPHAPNACRQRGHCYTSKHIAAKAAPAQVSGGRGAPAGKLL